MVLVCSLWPSEASPDDKVVRRFLPFTTECTEQMQGLVETGLSAAELCALHVSELAAYVLQTFDGAQRGGRVHPYSYNSDVVNTQYNRVQDVELLLALSEAWSFLEVQGLIVDDPTQSPPANGWVVLSRLGREASRNKNLKEVLAKGALPAQFLHPVIASDALNLFLRRDYDTAVFKAYRALEIAIREAAGFAEFEHGVTMVRGAFRPANPAKGVEPGPLTDASAPQPEQEALMNLMVGAIGSYKNPTSHRRLQLGSDDAREMLMLASHLLRIVDGRNGS